MSLCKRQIEDEPYFSENTRNLTDDEYGLKQRAKVIAEDNYYDRIFEQSIKANYYYQEKTKENTCPECGGSLMLPYYPHGFDNKGIIQCVSCDYSKSTKMVSWKKAKNSLKLK